MADENLFNELNQRELETLEILLLGGAAKTAVTIEQFIESRLAQGADPESIRQVLLTDLNEGGRIFGEFRSAVRSTAKGSTNRLRDIAEFSEFGVATQYRWSAVLVNTCIDCLSNHARVNTWEGWEASQFGLPRSGGTICRDNCRCVLIPSRFTEIEPIQRAKK